MHQMRKEMKHFTVWREEHLIQDEKPICRRWPNIFFICDQPNLVKTGQNSLSYFVFDKMFLRISWNHMKNLILDDLKLRLRLCPKITTRHINLKPFSVANVRLAASLTCICSWNSWLSDICLTDYWDFEYL